MKLSKAIFLTLLTTAACQTDAQEVASSVIANSDEDAILIEGNPNGWVDPGDIAPMTQCIAQQDQSNWLKAINQCTRKICTARFLFFCTHSEWLTELSCLSTKFSPDLVREYLPYCSRSILAKAQLYHWIHKMTGRTWLVDVGDANGLEKPSPASLTKGYEPISTTYKAPVCLREARSAPSMEEFQHVVASCTFTSRTQRIGDVERPWKHTSSVIALGFDTTGYDLTGHYIRYGEYFDKECFCSAFSMDPAQEPCSEPEPWQTDLTSERLWLNAMCGPESLPDDWTDDIKLIGSRYTPLKDWHWPQCVTDMPKQVTSLVDQCKTTACKLDDMGFCKTETSVNKACFCRDLSYDSCGGSCHIFERRIEYVKWLHDYCGSLEGWHGLPEDWRQLAIPTRREIIPWQWTLEPTKKCISSEWNLQSLIFVNMLTLVAFSFRGKKNLRNARTLLWSESSWVFRGILLAALQLGAHLVNATLVQMTPGYEDIPIGLLVFLWLTIPRLGWLQSLKAAASPRKDSRSDADASSLLTEILLQAFAIYYMGLTVFYGLKHNFFFSANLAGAEQAVSANYMFYGALLWFITALASIARLIWTALVISQFLMFELQMRGIDPEDLVAQINLLEEIMSPDKVEVTYTYTTTYGTLNSSSRCGEVVRKELGKLYARTALISLPILWIAQWHFWGGFLGLALENFCLPNLASLTAVWAIFSFVGAII